MVKMEKVHSLANISWLRKSPLVRDSEKTLDVNDLALRDTSFCCMDLRLP